MSPSLPNPRIKATLFAALGDETRLRLVIRLADGQPQSIAQLTAGSMLTRQAVTKHLLMLKHARLVNARRIGRENLFELNPQPLADLEQYLALVSERWSQALTHLRQYVEVIED